MANYGVIYGLYCDEYKDGVTYYVGKTEEGVEKRFTRHLYEARNNPSKARTHKDNWIRKCEKKGWVIQWRILQELEYGDSINSLERYWIRHFGRENLCNMTDGGEGQSGYVWSDERVKEQSTRARQVNRRRQRKEDGSEGLVEFSEDNGIEYWELLNEIRSGREQGGDWTKMYPQFWEEEDELTGRLSRYLTCDSWI